MRHCFSLVINQLTFCATLSNNTQHPLSSESIPCMQKQQKLRISDTPPLAGIRYPALSFYAAHRWPLLARTISALHIVLQMGWLFCSRRDLH